MLDLTKPVQTQSEKPVVLLNLRAGKRNDLLFGRVTEPTGFKRAFFWRPDGNVLWGDDGYALQNVPEKRLYERWVNVYASGLMAIFGSRLEADNQAALHGLSPRIACLHIRHEYEPGEGL